MKHISSADNKNIKLAVKLGDKKTRDQEELFLVEGKNSAAEVLKRPDLVRCFFIDEELMDQYENLLIEGNAWDCYTVDRKIMKRVCRTENPQGIAAIVRKPEWSLAEVVKDKGLVVLLDQISDPGNMGTIIRTSWAFNVNGILMTRGCADPFSPKVVRSTMGGILNMPLFANISGKQLDFLKEKQYMFMGADLSGGNSFYEMEFEGPKVIVIGSEAKGISSDIKNRCDYLFKIPINSSADSLNAAVACAIIIQEAYRQRYSG